MKQRFSTLLKNVSKLSTKTVFVTLLFSMWSISFITDVINPDYDPPQYINPLIMLAGGLFLATKNDSKEDKDGK